MGDKVQAQSGHGAGKDPVANKPAGRESQGAGQESVGIIKNHIGGAVEIGGAGTKQYAVDPQRADQRHRHAQVDESFCHSAPLGLAIVSCGADNGQARQAQGLQKPGNSKQRHQRSPQINHTVGELGAVKANKGRQQHRHGAVNDENHLEKYVFIAAEAAPQGISLSRGDHLAEAGAQAVGNGIEQTGERIGHQIIHGVYAHLNQSAGWEKKCQQNDIRIGDDHPDDLVEQGGPALAEG